MAALAPSLPPFHSPKPQIKSCRQNPSHFSASLLIKDSNKHNSKSFYPRRLRVIAATEGSAKKSRKSKVEGNANSEDASVPSWAKPGSDELPPWAREEAQKESSSTSEIPFVAYLLASAITAIAAIGSIFEYVNQRPVFGVLDSDSAFYGPVLGFFALTGIPSSAFLWYKSVQVANKEAEEQDRRDGYR